MVNRYKTMTLETTTMVGSAQQENKALTGALIPAFIHYALPAVIGLLAMTSSSIVDGVFIGRYVGEHALASINLLMPFISLIFSIGLMFAAGGSVRAGKYLGENNLTAASAIFSKTLIVVFCFSLLVIVTSLLFKTTIFKALGAGALLTPLMDSYFSILMPFILPQLLTIVLYFYIRYDGFSPLSATALIVSAVINIALDYYFIAALNLGLAGAAWATAISQLFLLLILLTYFLKPQRKLYLTFKLSNWGEIGQSAFNGLSDFINQVSSGGMMFILNWLLMLRIGVDGVAAITVVNYLIIMGTMVFFAIADACNIIISQNYGAKNAERIKQTLWLGFGLSMFFSMVIIIILLKYTTSLMHLFLTDDSTDLLQITSSIILILWPVFIVNGLNIVISGYFTALHLPIQSGLIALSRGFILPALLLVAMFFWMKNTSFLWAIPCAEMITFVFSGILFLQYTPGKIFSINGSVDL